MRYPRNPSNMFLTLLVFPITSLLQIKKREQEIDYFSMCFGFETLLKMTYSAFGIDYFGLFYGISACVSV